MLTTGIKEQIARVANDKAVQAVCIEAMFHECERGTDIWEYLEEDSPKFSKETRSLLWGSEVPFTYDSEDHEDERDCLYNVGDPHEVIDYLLTQVEDNLKRVLKGK